MASIRINFQFIRADPGSEFGSGSKRNGSKVPVLYYPYPNCNLVYVITVKFKSTKTKFNYLF